MEKNSTSKKRIIKKVLGTIGRPVLVLTFELEAEEQTMNDFQESLAKLDVQKRIQNRIEGRVEPEQPEGELVRVLVHASRTHRLNQRQECVWRLFKQQINHSLLHSMFINIK
jgi:hypothetical protein